jgi:hypothetical protein
MEGLLGSVDLWKFVQNGLVNSHDKRKDKIALYLNNIGYNNKNINNTINKAKEKMNITQKPPENQTPNNNTTYLPFIQGVTERISRVLNKKDTAYLPFKRKT